MSLINSTRDILRIGLREGTRYRAIVTDNVDPKKLCRVKFKIPKFFEFDPTVCPWAIPQSNGADGASLKAGTLNIPRIDSYVDIMFMGGSVYHPTYHATSVFSTVQLEKSSINYPDRKIMQLSNGCYLIVDEKDSFIDIFNPGDLRLTVNGTSNINIKGLCNLNVEGNVLITSTKGNITATAKVGEVTVFAETGNTTVMAKKNVIVNSTSGQIILQGPSGSSDLAGVVTGASICPFTGMPHSDYSGEVLATTGGK
jgi:hypothetical protein